MYTAHVLRQIPKNRCSRAMGRVALASAETSRWRWHGHLSAARLAHRDSGRDLSGGAAMEAPIYLDADFLLGPEAAQLTTSRLSGVATKTSAVEWLLASIFTHSQSKRLGAAICFKRERPDRSVPRTRGSWRMPIRAIYEKLGVKPAPFEQVRYFAPYTAKGFTLKRCARTSSSRHN